MAQPSLPLIGITSGLKQNKSGAFVCEVGQAYSQAIQKAGGLPVVIPVGLDIENLDSLLSRLDGVLFTGGGDIDPQYFRGEVHPKIYGISSERDMLEFALLEKSLRADLPLLAICRGIQVLNTGLGGTLHTDIQDQLPDALKHDWYPDFPRDKIAHTVSVTCGSRLHDILGQDEVPVNSLHHQGIAKVGQGLEAVAYAPDGLVEAVAVEAARFAIGVQWHPECLPDSPIMQTLFREFIKACL